MVRETRVRGDVVRGIVDSGAIGERALATGSGVDVPSRREKNICNKLLTVRGVRAVSLHKEYLWVAHTGMHR